MHPESESAPPTPVAPRQGLAIACLVLGIVGFLLSLFVVGIVFGVVGLALGLIHIVGKRGRNTLAWWGVALPS